MINSTYPTFDRNSLPRHNANVGAVRPEIRHNSTSKSQAAAILGSSTGGDKAQAAQKNGEKGGRPVGS